MKRIEIFHMLLSILIKLLIINFLLIVVFSTKSIAKGDLNTINTEHNCKTLQDFSKSTECLKDSKAIEEYIKSLDPNSPDINKFAELLAENKKADVLNDWASKCKVCFESWLPKAKNLIKGETIVKISSNCNCEVNLDGMDSKIINKLNFFRNAKLASIQNLRVVSGEEVIINGVFIYNDNLYNGIASFSKDGLLKKGSYFSSIKKGNNELFKDVNNALFSTPNSMFADSLSYASTFINNKHITLNNAQGVHISNNQLEIDSASELTVNDITLKNIQGLSLSPEGLAVNYAESLVTEDSLLSDVKDLYLKLNFNYEPFGLMLKALPN